MPHLIRPAHFVMLGAMFHALQLVGLVVLALAFALVPAPRPEPQTPAHADPLVGAWALDWGCVKQTTHFHDGPAPHRSCWSPEFGGGTWSIDNEGYIWFSEREGASQYVMWFDWQTGGGSGWRVDRDTGEVHGCVPVKMRRGERLHVMPREIEVEVERPR